MIKCSYRTTFIEGGQSLWTAVIISQICRNARGDNIFSEKKEALFKPARDFYEATLCISFCHSFLPDSVGPIDRILYPFYQKGIAEGTLTKEEAKLCLQDLYIIIQANVSILNNEIAMPKPKRRATSTCIISIIFV